MATTFEQMPEATRAPLDAILESMTYLGGAALLSVLNGIDSVKDVMDEFIDGRIAADAAELMPAHSRWVGLIAINNLDVTTDMRSGYHVSLEREIPALDLVSETKVAVTLTEEGLKPYISATRVVTDGLFEHREMRYNQTRNPRHRNTLSPLGVWRAVRKAKRHQKLDKKLETHNMKEAAEAVRHILGLGTDSAR